MKSKILSARVLALVPLFVLLPFFAFAQQIANYEFSSEQSSSNPTVSSGNVELTKSLSFSDGRVYNSVAIGFPFFYMGNTFHKISVSSKGFFIFGDTLNLAHPSNSLAGTSLKNVIAPLWDDLGWSNSNSKIYTYTNPSKTEFTIEWRAMEWPRSSNNQISLFVKLDNNGRISIAYLNYNWNENQASSRSASIGISGSAINSFISIDMDTYSHVVSVNEFSANSKRPGPQTDPIKYRYFRFTPPTSTPAPTNITALRVNYYHASLAWTPASETQKYTIFRDNGDNNFAYVGDATGDRFEDPDLLDASKVYSYRVYGRMETLGAYGTVTSASCGAAYLSGLQSNYKLNGNARDETGFNPGEFLKSPVSGVDSLGNQNAAIIFNGSNQYMATTRAIQHHERPVNFTTFLKFKTTSTLGGKLISYGNARTGISGERDRQIYIDYLGNIHFNAYSHPAGKVLTISSSGATKYNDGKWHYAAATLSQDNGMRLYVDGKLIGSNSNVGTGQQFTGEVAGYWRVGFDRFGVIANNPGSNPASERQDYYFGGSIDDVYIFNRVLSLDEINSLRELNKKVAGYISVYCIGAMANLKVSALAGASYTWTGPSGFSSLEQNPTFVMTSDHFGVYEVRVRKDNCVFTYSTEIKPYTDTDKAIWTGNNSNSLTDGSNWCGGVLPPASVVKEIVKVTAPSKDPIINDSQFLNKVRVNNGAILTLASGGNFSVDSIDIVNGGKVIVNDGGNLLVNIGVKNAGELDVTSGKITFKGVSTHSIAPNLFKSGRVKDLALENSAKVSLEGDLRLTGVLSAIGSSELSSNNRLTIGADAASQASVAPLSSTAKIFGAVKVENYVRGGAIDPFRTFRMFSSSVYDNSLTFTNNISDVRRYKVRQLHDDMIITGEGGSSKGFETSVQNRPSAWTYNDDGYVAVTDLDTPVDIGRGVYVYYRGDKTNANAKIYGPYTGNVESRAINFSGTLNQQDVFVNLNNTRATGYALLGNPYASPISVKNLSKTNLGNKYWTFNPGARNYIAYTDEVGVNNGGDVIGVGEAFFIDLAGANSTVTFKESDKITATSLVTTVTATSGGHVSIMEASPIRNRDIIRMEMKSLVSYGKDEIALVFEDGADANYTTKDVEHWDGEQVNLSSASADGRRLSISFMPTAKNNDVIKLFTTALYSGSYILQFNTNGYYGNNHIILKDNYLGTTTTVNSGSQYQFTIDLSNNKTFGSDRFALEFKDPLVVLPLNLTSFKAVKDESSVKLSWSLSEVQGVQYFRVLRFGDGDGAKEIATVNASLAKSYYVLDNNPGFGRNYYKLFAVNKSGEEVEIGVVDVNFEMLNDNMIYPNPFKDVLNIRFKNATNGVYEVKLVDVAGKVFISKTTTAKKLADGFIIDTSILEKGLYILNVSSKISGQQLHSSSVEKAY